MIYNKGLDNPENNAIHLINYDSEWFPKTVLNQSSYFSRYLGYTPIPCSKRFIAPNLVTSSTSSIP